MIENVPNEFKVLTNHEYPPYNRTIFEEFFMYNYGFKTVDLEYTYLPVLWTNLYISRNYSNGDMSDLQKYLDSLDRSKKYFTIIQYDDGLLENIEDLNIKVFGAGGGGYKSDLMKLSEKNLGYPIPLICNPNPYIIRGRERDILCSFVGSFNTHPIRQKIRDLYEKQFVLKDKTDYKVFADMMERSIFSLCPRGYGATSFRICEALQYGSIPVYIYDKPWFPWKDEFDFNDIGISIPESEIPDILNILQSKTEDEIYQYVESGREIYREYFTYNGCAEKIISKLHE